MQARALLVRRPSKSRRRAPLLVPIVAALMLGVAGPVQATITPSSTALTIAQAIASSSLTVTAASFVAVPPSGTPNGVSTSVLGGFPVDGADYGILTSGDVSSVDQPGAFADSDDGGGNVRGDTDLDVSILKVDVTVPAGANCLTFNFKFLSEEYPVYVGSSFNDAFIAELDTSDWTTSGSTISAPHNFAFDASNDVVSINSTGLGGMSPAAGVGTAFDGPAGPGPDTNGAATALLGAATPVTAGAHSIYLSLFDQGDNALDSAVFLDNMRTGSVPNPATDCKQGAAEPAHLTLTKAIDNTGGGTAQATDWTLSATGPTTISGHTGDPAITAAAVGAGTYILAEAGPAGYSASAWGCTGGTLTGSSLVLAAGATASCSITNTFVPVQPEPAHLTLTKAIDNTGGGTAQATDWTLSATGPTTISGHTGDPAITAAAVGAGTYILAEAGPAGYSASAWGCTGGTLTGSSLVLAAGATASCSITNTFVPVQPEPAHLTLTKAIDNTGGGTAQATDWTLSATGPTTISGHTGDPAITAAAVGAGTYILAEAGPAGYSASAWGCTGGTLTGSSLVLAAGATASCSITNTFVPVQPEPAHLTLTKAIDNTGGGTAQATDWTLSATGPTTISGHTGDPAITAAAVGAGTYILAEAGPAGYSASAWGCTGGTLTGSSLVLAAGATASCSITNTFVPVQPEPAHLTLTKAIDNTGGGTAQATDWTLSATGPTTISGHTGDPAITAAAVGAGTYILAEAGPAGYSASAWGCTGGTLTGSSLVLAAGATASCSITNTFVPRSSQSG